MENDLSVSQKNLKRRKRGKKRVLPDQEYFTSMKREAGELTNERELLKETENEIAAREETRALIEKNRKEIENALPEDLANDMPIIRFVDPEVDVSLPNGGLMSKQDFDSIQKEGLDSDMSKSPAELTKQLLSAVDNLSHLVQDEDSKVWLSIGKEINDNLTKLAHIFSISLNLSLDPAENASAITTELFQFNQDYIILTIGNNKEAIVKIIRNLEAVNYSFKQDVEDAADRFQGFL